MSRIRAIARRTGPALAALMAAALAAAEIGSWYRAPSIERYRGAARAGTSRRGEKRAFATSP